jgi:hypothetical protein
VDGKRTTGQGQGNLEFRTKLIYAGPTQNVNEHGGNEEEGKGRRYTFNSQRLEARSCDRVSGQLHSGLNVIRLALKKISHIGIEQFAGTLTLNHVNILISLRLIRICSVD